MRQEQKNKGIDIIKYGDFWAEHYFACEKQKAQYKIAEESQNQPWELARSRAKNRLENKAIDSLDIVNFACQKKANILMAKKQSA